MSKTPANPTETTPPARGLALPACVVALTLSILACAAQAFALGLAPHGPGGPAGGSVLALGGPSGQLFPFYDLGEQEDGDKPPPSKRPSIPDFSKTHAFLNKIHQKYLTVDSLCSYFALIFAALFMYYFVQDFKIGFMICRITFILTIVLLYYFTCKNFKCDIYKYLHIYLIPPALYCTNGSINRLKYVLIPPAALLFAVIFTYEFEIPIIICSLFIAINILYIIKFLVKHKKNPKFMPYLRQMVTLAAIAACGYIISLHLSKQMYFKAYKFITSWM